MIAVADMVERLANDTEDLNKQVRLNMYCLLNSASTPTRAPVPLYLLCASFILPRGGHWVFVLLWHIGALYLCRV